VVEGAAKGQLLVVEPERVDGHLAAAEEEDGPAGADELQGVLPRLGRADRLDDDVGAAAVARLGAELPRELPPLRPAADGDDVGAGVLRGGAEHEPDRPRAEDRDGLTLSDLGPLDPVQAAGERLHHRGHLGREAGRDGQEVALRDAPRHEQELGVRAV
jgi:hypothetical protein